MTDAPGGDITGYRLEKDDGLGGDFSIIYDGLASPSVTTFVVGGATSPSQVVAGRAYRFRLTAWAFNGLGPVSLTGTVYACTAPTNLAPPLLGSIHPTSYLITITWSEPADSGACPLLGFSLLVDDGVSGNPTTPVAGVATDVPVLRSATF
jgi:hypothetical protein